MIDPICRANDLIDQFCASMQSRTIDPGLFDALVQAVRYAGEALAPEVRTSCPVRFPGEIACYATNLERLRIELQSWHTWLNGRSQELMQERAHLAKANAWANSQGGI